MLTILHPEILPRIAALPAGLSPLTVDGEKRIILVIKGPKEAILAAKMNQGFRFYLAPIDVNGIRTSSLITAFFDDDQSPMHILTPLFGDDDLTSVLFRLLASETFDVHFFDESNRELLGYRATNKGSNTLRPHLADILFWPFDFELLREYHDKAITWFVNRTPLDDEQAFEIRFGEALVPEDIFIQDLTPKATAFHGATGPGHTVLERDGEPGKFQERDIVDLLQRVFTVDQIYLNPHKADDGLELVDILVVSPTNVVFVQAKDSPNTERSLRRSISRKMKTVEEHVTKAARQLRGTLSYVNSNNPLKLIVNGEPHEISLEGRARWGLIVVKETFGAEYSAYSPPVLELARDSGVPCLLLDYHELHNFTHHRHTERDLLESFKETFEFAVKHNQFPRSRFGFATDATS